MAETPAVVRKLIDGLIPTIIDIDKDSDPVNFEICQQFILNGIKHHTFLSPNHFDTYKKLAGYSERFSVLCKDSIAEALETRVKAVRNSNYKFTAEVLAFLLHLSYRPFDRENLDDLEETQNVEPEKKELTWEDIIAEEPLEGDIWDEIDYGAASDLSYDSENERQKRAERNRRKMQEKDIGSEDVEMEDSESVEEEEEKTAVDPSKQLECFIYRQDKASIDIIKGAQYWTARVTPMPTEVDVSLSADIHKDAWLLSEAQSIREVLFMLSGAPTNLFVTQRDGSYTVYHDLPHVVQKFCLRHASLETFISTLRWFAEHGTALKLLRRFADSRNEIPTIEAFIGTVSSKVTDVNRILAKIQARFVRAKAQRASLMQLQSELDPILRPYYILSEIVSKTMPLLESGKYFSKHLDWLYEETCNAQCIGDTPTFDFMMGAFFSCLQSYLRPIREWMESGSIRPSDTEFFVQKAQAYVESGANLNTLWHDQFLLLKDPTGRVQVSTFLQSSVDKIFTTGKSVVFLKKLIDYQVPPIPSPSRIELEQSALYNSPLASELAPFDQLFGSALDEWIHDKHHSIGSKLREVLFTECQLWRSLEALEYIYFMKDGSRLTLLTSTLFEKIEKGREIWNDRFLLTELVQSVFADIPCVDPSKLTAKTTTRLLRPSQTKNKTIKLLGGLLIDYTLPWPIMNLIPPSSFAVYRAIQHLILQISRARTTVTSLLKLPLPRKAPPVYHSLRHRFTAFANTINSYIIHLVIIPQTEKLKAALNMVVDMDSMIAVHGRYIRRINEMCFLGRKLKPIHTAILSILELAVRFAGRWKAKSGAGKKGRRLRRRDEGSDEDDDEEGETEGGYDGETSGAETETEALSGADEEEYLRKTDDQLEKNVAFVRSGLKGMARAGASMAHLDTLGEELW